MCGADYGKFRRKIREKRVCPKLGFTRGPQGSQGPQGPQGSQSVGFGAGIRGYRRLQDGSAVRTRQPAESRAWRAMSASGAPMAALVRHPAALYPAYMATRRFTHLDVTFSFIRHLAQNSAQSTSMDVARRPPS
eukprot:5328941-Prymnesium_polylepis.1